MTTSALSNAESVILPSLPSDEVDSDEKRNVIQIATESGEVVTLKGRPCELSAYSFIPQKRMESKELSYFNNDKKDHYPESNTYDRLFHPKYGYKNKLHRDDRDHAKLIGLSTHKEEFEKGVPVLSSKEYGKRWQSNVDPASHELGHRAIVKEEFYRRSGANLRTPQNLKDLSNKNIVLGDFTVKDHNG